MKPVPYQNTDILFSITYSRTSSFRFYRILIITRSYFWECIVAKAKTYFLIKQTNEPHHEKERPSFRALGQTKWQTAFEKPESTEPDYHILSCYHTIVSYFLVFQMPTISYVFLLQLWSLAVQWPTVWHALSFKNRFMLISDISKRSIYSIPD